eukprot:2482027-Prymnesium_polylepis.1
MVWAREIFIFADSLLCNHAQPDCERALPHALIIELNDQRRALAKVDCNCFLGRCGVGVAARGQLLSLIHISEPTRRS